MKQQRPIIEKLAKHLAKSIAEQEVYGWPPQCAALYYQPVRPKIDGTRLMEKNEEETR